MSCTLRYFKFWVFAFWNTSPNIKCSVALTKLFLSQIFLHFGKFYFYSRQICNKRLANWTAITDTYHCMDLQGTLGNSQIWLGTPPVVLQFILVFFHFMVCNCLFAKNIRSHSDIGKMKETFNYMCL